MGDRQAVVEEEGDNGYDGLQAWEAVRERGRFIFVFPQGKMLKSEGGGRYNFSNIEAFPIKVSRLPSVACDILFPLCRALSIWHSHTSSNSPMDRGPTVHEIRQENLEIPLLRICIGQQSGIW